MAEPAEILKKLLRKPAEPVELRPVVAEEVVAEAVVAEPAETEEVVVAEAEA